MDKDRRIAELESEVRTLRQTAIKDELTGLLNRRGIIDRLDPMVAEAAYEGHRRKLPPALTVAIADIDQFKKINDQNGHQAGDEALRKFADQLLSSFRGTDVVGRMGGEEFLIALAGTELSESVKIIDRLRRRLSRDNGFTVSFGLAQVKPGEDTQVVIDRADQALYRAKQSGRDRVEIA